MPLVFAVIIVFIGLWGMNFTFWGAIGLCRYISLRIYSPQVFAANISGADGLLTKSDVAIIIPAHQEELVIENTLKGALRLLPPNQIFIITSDFSKKDRTADIARSFGVNVVELPPPLAKARKLQSAVNQIQMSGVFKAVLFVDADTILADDYLDKALPYFNDPEVVAVAGHATTLWEPNKNSWFNRFILSYRERIYFFGQLFIKFGQSWKYINVCQIVPGFASIYRSSILSKINIDPGGLVIEDFNMTFEVHHGHLGKIIYSPEIKAYTQDPDNLKDYFKQIKRWNLGFWQTVFRHGYWTSFFWSALFFSIFEVCLSSIILLLLPFYIFLIFLSYGVGDIPYQYILLLKGLFIADYALSVVIGVIKNRPAYFIYGLGFLFMRFIDAIAYMYSIPKAIFTTSTGAWASPTRR